jgi:hypothetical protein
MAINKHMVQETEERQLQWYSHVMQLQDDKLVKTFVE